MDSNNRGSENLGNERLTKESKERADSASDCRRDRETREDGQWLLKRMGTQCEPVQSTEPKEEL